MHQVDNKRLQQFLLDAEIIDSTDLQDAFQFAEDNNVLLSQVLVERELISDSSLGTIVADLYGIPFVNLSQISISPEVLQIIPENVAREQQIIAFKEDDNGLHVAKSNPIVDQLLQFLHKKSNKPVHLYYTTPNNISATLRLYLTSMKEVFDSLIEESLDSKSDSGKEPPIIKIVDTIIEYAYHNSASDIHIEPLDDEMLVRYRIDGVLHDMIRVPLEVHTQIVTRIKVMAKLRTDEHQEAQDGKIVFSTAEEELDLRVSIASTTKGEKIVMRLLSDKNKQFSLADLGLAGKDLEKLTQAYSLPHGMILVTGPTGSGKTTTLYSVLKKLNSRDINIMTIEDPVEYEMETVNQLQVNKQTGQTFAEGLRSIVRQDPDVILVGEIRDEETADIAINSAMTGHLVLSTLHTNDAVTSFPRLIDMGVEPYLVASTVKVVVAQRLVRKICSQCRGSNPVDMQVLDTSMKEIIQADSSFRAYKGKGCLVCHHTGYRGRVGIFEVLVVDEAISKAVTEKKNSNELQILAKKQGMTTLMEDGLKKVKQGITTLEEIMRVTRE